MLPSRKAVDRSLDFKVIVSTVPSMQRCFGVSLLYLCAAAFSIPVHSDADPGVVTKEEMVGVRQAIASGEGIVGVVNNDILSKDELRDMIEPAARKARQTLSDTAYLDKLLEIEAVAVNKLITRTLILQAAKREGLTVPEAAIDERVQQIIDAQYAGNRDSFLRFIQAKGYMMEKFREAQRNDLLVEEMRKKVVRGAANPGEAEQTESAWLQTLRKKAYIKIY